MTRFRASVRADALVFALVLVGAGYFHQGGGWNQNSRFALVRSIVESGSFFIDSYLVYEKDPSRDGSFVRVPIEHGNVRRGGDDIALAWRGSSGNTVPVDPAAAGARKLAAIDDVAASGDVSYYAGHFHPNKAPGTSFAAVPGYALVRLAGRIAGANPDSWAAVTVGAWLASLLSVGFATAFGAVFVLRLARDFASELAARAAALVFAFATMAWTYGTMLFEHNIIAASLAGSAYLIREAARHADGDATAPGASRLVAGAGFLAGYAAIANYTMALLVPVFALFLYAERRRTNDVAAFAAGVAVPLVVICAYNVACFGTPFTTNYAYESPMFLAAGTKLFGVFALPRLDVAAALLFSPFRGLFYSSPVLLAAVAGTVVLWRDARTQSLAMLIAAVGVFLLLVNASFNGWDGGWCAVPRYLAPGMALLTVPIAVAFDRWRAVTCGLAAISFVIQLLLVAVDPQVPVGEIGLTGGSVASIFRFDPMTRYVLPLFVSNHPWPMIDEAIERSVARSAQQAAARGVGKSEIERKSAELRTDYRNRIEKGENLPLDLAAVVGPVSANPIGVYEGYYFQKFAAHSFEASWNSFNAGEYVFPKSRLSLLPLLLVAGGLVALLFQTDDELEVVAAAPRRTPSLSRDDASPSREDASPARGDAPAPQRGTAAPQPDAVAPRSPRRSDAPPRGRKKR